MLLFRSMVVAACTVIAIGGELQWRRYLMGPGGDPSHQGGHGILYPPPQQQGQSKQYRCVSQNNPCRCSMHFATEMRCLTCDCTNHPQTVSYPEPATYQWLPSSTAPAPLPTGTSTATTPSTVAPSVPPVAITTTGANAKTTTTIDYCDVAKQLCQANCPDGYLIDPTDCTFCICKKDVIG